MRVDLPNDPTGAEADEHLLAEVLWQHRRLSGLKLREVIAVDLDPVPLHLGDHVAHLLAHRIGLILIIAGYSCIR